MALIGNRSVLAKGPGRAFSGGVSSDVRSACNKSGANQCRHAGGFNQNSGTPNGRRPPTAWVLAVKDGNMSSYTTTLGVGEAQASGKAALKGEGSAAGSALAEGIGSTIAALVGAAAGSSTVTGLLIAYLLGQATADGSSTASAALSATGTTTAIATGGSSVAGTLRGDGRIVGASTPFTELSPQSLATAVWSAVVAEQTDDVSMGFALRVANAVLRNRVITDPTAGTYSVYDDDNTLLLSGALWEDAAGATPYSGSGAERRDRLV